MAEYNLGRSGGDFSDLTRRSQEASASIDELNQKTERYRTTEGSSAQADAQAASRRTDTAAATNDLAAALERSTAGFSAETAAINASNAALARNLELRRALTSEGGVGAAGRGGAAVAPIIGAPVTGFTAAQEAARSDAAQINAGLQAQRAAQERAVASTNAEAAALAEAAVRARGQLALPPGGGGLGPTAELPAGRSPLLLEQSTPRTAERAAFQYANFPPPTRTGGYSDPTTPPTEGMAQYRAMVRENTDALTGLEAAQARANARFQMSSAIYADSSNALSRHGALTTEFISALARGDVTMKEFGSQMTATIGKFGGWAIAGAAVYGVFNAFRDLTEGATETQAAVQQLGRFIPGLGGPAGGGVGQIPAAESAVRNISTEFNVPIRDVVASMSVMARTFHSVSDAADATRAALAVSRLDLISPQQAEQYLPAISRSLGFSHGSQLIGVINGLNELQSQYGARVSETLPAFARAAPAAIASGTDPSTLAALAALGVRAGLPGSQVGTALLRSMGTFAFQPGSELTFAEYGIHPQIGNYRDLVRQVFGLIDRREKEGNPLQGEDLIRLGRAFGGPLLGSRVFPALLLQEQRHPGTFSQGVADFEHPRPYQDDLSRVLGTVSERFKSIGIALQAFGSSLAQAGALTPLTALLDVMTHLIHGFDAVTNALGPVVGIFNELPGPMRDAIGMFLAFRALRAFAQTRFGTATQALAGRLPGLDWLQEPANQRLAVQNQVARIRNVLLPDAEAEQMAANRRWQGATADVRRQQDRLTLYEAQGRQQLPGEAEGVTLATLPESDQRAQEYQSNIADMRGRLGTAMQAELAAQQEAADAARETAALRADATQLTRKEVSYADRTAYMVARGMTAAEDYASFEGQAAKSAQALMESARRAAAEGGLSAAAGAAGLSTVADAGAVGLGLAGAGGVWMRREPPTPPLSEEAVSAPVVAEEQTQAGILARGSQRVMQGASAAGAFLGGPGGPLAGLLLAQSLPQGSLSTGLSNGFSDALVAQLIKPGNVGFGLAAFGLGLATTPAGGTSGTIQHAVGGALTGGFLGRTVAPFLSRGIGAALDIEAPEIGVPLTIAGALGGGALGGIFGPTPSVPPQQQSAWGVNADALSAINAARRGNLGAFQSNIGGLLQSAYLGTGASAQRGQQSVQSVVQSLTAQLQLFGGQSVQGRFASSALGTVYSAAADLAQENPQITQQIVQSITQTRSQEIQRQLQYSLATGTGTRGAVGTAIAQTQETVSPLAQQTDQARSDAAGAQEELAQREALAAGASGRTRQQLDRQVAAQRTLVTEAQSHAQILQSMLTVAQQSAVLQEQQFAQMGYQADIQSQQAQTQLQVAQAGGNTRAQLQASLSGARQGLSTSQTYPHLDPRTRAQQVAQYRAQIIDTQNRITQQQLTELQGQGAVREAQVPIGDPVAAARQRLADLQQQYQFVVANRQAFDPKDVNDLLAQVIQAKHDLATTAADFATQMSDIQTQIAQARDYGNAVQQAADAIAGAQRDLSLAVTPQQQATAQANLAQAQVQMHQAYMSQIQAQGQLAASQHPGDPVAAAQAIVTSARQQLAAAQGVDEQTAAQTALNNAIASYHQALEQQATSIAALQASTTTNPLQKLRDEIAGATKALSVAQGPSNIRDAQTNLNNLKNQYRSTLIDTRESTTQFQLDMMQISAQQALTQLQDLLKMKGITLQQRQAIEEEIRRIQLGDYSTIGGGPGSFDLSPGNNVPLPTPYDVRRSMHHAAIGRMGPGRPMVHMQAATQINVYVNRNADIHQVADAIDRTTGSQLRARLRSVGLRGG